jgi:hypothetical protein
MSKKSKLTLERILMCGSPSLNIVHIASKTAEIKVAGCLNNKNSTKQMRSRSREK